MSKHSLPCGAAVFHIQYGAGTVVGTTQRVIADIPTDLYVVAFTDGPREQIPTGNTRLRPIASRTEVATALRCLTKPRQHQRLPWGRRERESREALNDGSIKKRAEVARNLHGPSDRERGVMTELYDTAVNLLSAEVAHVYNLPQSDVRTAIEDTIHEGRLAPLLQEKL